MSEKEASSFKGKIFSDMLFFYHFNFLLLFDMQSGTVCYHTGKEES